MPGTQPETAMPSAITSLLIWVAVGILIGGLVYFVLPKAPQPTSPTLQNTTPQAPPSNATAVQGITVTMISEPRCPACNSTKYLLAQLVDAAPKLKLNVTAVTQLDSNSAEAQALISKYSIKLLPSFIVSKEAGSSSDFTSAWSSIGSEESDGSFVFRKVYPPYFDVETGAAVGFVDLTEIPPADCEDCFNTSQFTSFLTGDQVAMVLRNQAVLVPGSAEAKALIARYNITRLPALLLSKDAGAYPYIDQEWPQLGTVASDGTYVFSGLVPPYADLTKNGAIEGRVTLVELIDPSCKACYDVSLHYQSLRQSFGMVVTNRTTYYTNTTAGKALLAKYNITLLPTIVLSPDAALYPGFNQSWSKIGTAEKDGWLVMRNLDTLGVVYMNLTSGNVMNGTA